MGIPGVHIRYLYLFLLMETVWHAVLACPTYRPASDCHLPGVSYLAHGAALCSSRPLRDSLSHYSRSTRHLLAYGDVLLPYICCRIAYLPCFLLRFASLLYVVTGGWKKCTLFYFFHLFDSGCYSFSECFLKLVDLILRPQVGQGRVQTLCRRLMVTDISFACLFYILVFIFALARCSSHFLHLVFVAGQGGFSRARPHPYTGPGGYVSGNARPAPAQGLPALIPWAAPFVTTYF